VNFAPLQGNNCIEVTSPRSREGKTETVANLAVLAARSGQRVVVVDCDLRFPRVHDYFGLSNEVGFTSVVHGEPLSGALQRVPGVERLYVLSSGPIPSNPSELLASERCHEVLSSLQADDTLVIVDTPPLLVVTDAAALAPSAGGILVVAAARVTRRKQVRQALEVLRQISAPVLGLVLYRADSAEIAGYGQGAGRRERKYARRRRVESRATGSRSGVG
jgi:non-specific protein-tyrosine kinase